MHEFFVPASNTIVAKPHHKTTLEQSLDEKDTINKRNALDMSTKQTKQMTHYRLWGMTARIGVDAARIAYARDPDFEHNSHAGDEKLITEMRQSGRLSEVRRRSTEARRTLGTAPDSKLS